MRVPRSLHPTSLYDDGCNGSSMPAGLPKRAISVLSNSSLNRFGNNATSVVSSYKSAMLSCHTVQSAAAATTQPVQSTTQNQPLAASQSCSFAAAPALCYSPAEPALKEPLGDVLRRAGKRCCSHWLCHLLMSLQTDCQRKCHSYDAFITLTSRPAWSGTHVWRPPC